MTAMEPIDGGEERFLEVLAARKSELSPSERRVADFVLQEPDKIIRMSIASLAETVGVSQPTVLRFVRAIGLASYPELKLRTGQSIDGQLARWTSYGLNSFTTRFATPFVQDPHSSRALGPWDSLPRIPRPDATVHVLQMTEGVHGDPEFATADHVHPEDFANFGEPDAPAYATTQMEIFAHGGKPRSWDAAANYGFLDGHAATLKFRNVYRSSTSNRFCPDFAF